jgi:2-oxoglutarate dehydrogenase E2 component (dihydrolipoamide succinyltransferase)
MLPIKVPPLGESIVEATVSRWQKKEGDAVAAGDTLVELETDKITVEVPALKPGVLTRQAKKEGDVVHVDDVLGEIDEAAVPAATSAPALSQSRPAATQQPAAAPAGETVKSSPAARRIADERGIDIAAVSGTGRGGVVSKPDVLAVPSGGDRAAAPRPTSPPPIAPPRGGNGAAPGDRETREKMSTRRKRIAENLLQSQHATAHLTTFNEVDMSAVNALRERFKEKVEKEHGVKLTFMPFFVRAAVQALRQFPNINAMVAGDTIV